MPFSASGISIFNFIGFGKQRLVNERDEEDWTEAIIDIFAVGHEETSSKKCEIVCKEE